METENITVDLCEMSEESSFAENIPSVETSDFGLTRYLYVIDDVKSSLVLAILERKLDEALFWAYELYFSGFKDDVFCILEQMVSLMYSKYHPKLVTFLENKKKLWDETGAYCIVGTFVYNMIIRDYDVSEFVKVYCKDPEIIKRINENAKSTQKTKSKIYIHVEQKDVIKYMTVNHIKPHCLLKKTVKYQIRKNTVAIFDHEHGIYSFKKMKMLYLNHWLYYACASSIWKERVDKHDGIIDHPNRCVKFTSAENEEKFYEKYNLETDEQPKQIQIMNIGTGLEEQMDWTEFYEKYYCE